MRNAVDLAEAFADKSAANLDTDPLEKIRAAGANLGSFDTGDITIGYFRGTSPWERHIDGDEFFYLPHPTHRGRALPLRTTWARPCSPRSW